MFFFRKPLKLRTLKINVFVGAYLSTLCQTWWQVTGVATEVITSRVCMKIYAIECKNAGNDTILFKCHATRKACILHNIMVKDQSMHTTGQNQFLFSQCNTEWTVPGYGSSVLPMYVHECSQDYNLWAQPYFSRWPFLQSAQEKVSLQSRCNLKC